MKAYAPTANNGQFQDHQSSKTRAIRGDFVPVYMAIGIIALSLSLELHTEKQQLMHSPGAGVKKEEERRCQKFTSRIRWWMRPISL